MKEERTSEKKENKRNKFEKTSFRALNKVLLLLFSHYRIDQNYFLDSVALFKREECELLSEENLLESEFSSRQLFVI